MIKQLRDNTWKQIDHDRVSIVKIGASWCGPCKFLKPHFAKWSERFAVYNDTTIKYYEIDGDLSPSFKEAFKIDRYPTTLFFVHGVLVFKQHGITTAEVFEGLLAKTLEIKFERNGNVDTAETGESS